MPAALAAVDDADPAPTPLGVGFARVDITPPRPVILVGQNYERVADPADAYDRLTATAMALDATQRGRGDPTRQAVLISLDIVGAYDLGLHLKERLAQEPWRDSTPGLDPDRIILFATHTHTGPYVNRGKDGPKGTMRGAEYHDFLVEQLARLVVEAWAAREPMSLGRAHATAAVGFNRVAVYADGSAKMYGDTTLPTFTRMEGPVDHGVELLYAFDATGTPRGVVVNVAAPAQVLEARRYLSADYWAEVRKQVAADPALGPDVMLLPMCGAAGDQAPRDLQREGAATREHGWDHPDTEAIGRLLATMIAAAMPDAAARRDAHPVVRHVVRDFTLPRKDGRDGGPFPVTLHALRLGDAAVVDVPFELYTAYGLDIKRRSPADQTLIAQLASGPAYGMYLPTQDALAGQAYGSRLNNGQVGPDGGQQLVDHIVDALNDLYR